MTNKANNWTAGISGIERSDGKRFDFTRIMGIVWCQSCLAQIPEDDVGTHECVQWWDVSIDWSNLTQSTPASVIRAVSDSVRDRLADPLPIPPPNDPAERQRYDTTFYQVNEQFTSIQGEGVYTGVPSTFIRLQGCSVGCEWCDSGPLADKLFGRATNGLTRNTWGRGGKQMSLTDIVAGIKTRHVVVTGGEPTIWNLDPILQACWDIGCVVQLETSGQNALKGQLAPDWITWSPKQRLDYAAPISILDAVNEVKWVVDDYLPFARVWSTWTFFNERASDGNVPIFVLMPEGSPPKPQNVGKALEWLTRIPLKWQDGWRYGHRLQYVLGVR